MGGNQADLQNNQWIETTWSYALGEKQLIRRRSTKLSS